MVRGDGPDHTRIDAAYVRRLERENAELRMDRDVLTRLVHKREVKPTPAEMRATTIAASTRPPFQALR
jgi:hypothetical protein